MSLSALIAWEVRTTGSDSNGGGFVSGASGTDYSQQATAQFSGTNLASTNGTSGSPAVTSATHNFVAADVGNVIHITAGTNWTAGFYEIVSVAANAATLDRACGSSATLSGGTWAEGGALATPGQAGGAKAQGNDVWILAGTYTLTTATPNVSGGPVLEVFSTGGGVDQHNYSRWEGYGTARGDKGTPPVIAVPGAGVNTLDIFKSDAQFVLVDNITVNGNFKTAVQGMSANNFYNTFIRCTATQCTKNGILLNDAGCIAIKCRATLNSNTYPYGGIKLSESLGSGQHAFGCVADNNVGYGFVSGGSTNTFDFCIAYANQSAGFIGISVGLSCRNCVSYGNYAIGAAGFDMTGNAGFFAPMINCIAEGNAGEGFLTDSVGQGILLTNCAGYNNGGSGNYNASYIPSANIESFVSGSASFFTNAAASDFSLNSLPGGGALLKAAGIPGVFPGGTTTGYMDIGAAQAQAGAAVMSGVGMFLDSAKNFAKSTVSIGYDASATSIVLSTGGGAKFSTPPFNATWFNSSDYADPADDPNVEIVRVMAIATDTVTIQRAQEGTSASTKNTGGKTYTLVATPTAQTVTDLLGYEFYVKDEPMTIAADRVLVLNTDALAWTDAVTVFENPWSDYQPETSVTFFPGTTTVIEDDPYILDSGILADLGGNNGTLLWTDAARCPQTVSTLLVIGV